MKRGATARFHENEQRRAAWLSWQRKKVAI